jgi:hypothetical protein
LKSLARRATLLGLFDTPASSDVTTCCALKGNEGKYSYAPEPPCSELMEAIARVGQNVVISMASEVTTAVIDSIKPGQVSLIVESTGSRTPIVANLVDIQQSLVNSSCSCIVTGEKCVVVWSSEPKALINIAHNTERQMLSSVGIFN